MKCITLLLLLISSCGVLGRNIPSNLLDCYTNQTLMERDNRLPATLTTLIDIIRKLELLYSYDMRVLSTALINTFRVDGITFNPNIPASDGVSPYGIQGFQKEKHALLKHSFFPQNTEEIDVTILTPFEKCALHFMLSDSIEYHKRGNEGTACANMQAYRRRRTRRDIIAAVDANEFASNDTIKQVAGSNTSEKVQPPQGKVVNKESVNGMDSFPVPVINTTTVEKITPLNNSDVVLPETKTDGLVSGNEETSVNVSQSSEVKSVKAELDESPTDVKEPVVKVEEPVLDVNKPSAKPVQSAKLTLGKYTQIEVSQCPVENGVIYNKWGSLTAVNVIAGIATGIQIMENVKFNDIYPDSANANTTSLVMDNRWAATLAGDLAEVVIHQGPKTDPVKVGTPGGWNDSVTPHWYFINRVDQTQMTDAEIRGGLDGLIMAKNIATWRGQKPNLRLSHILQQYYSENGVLNSQYKACSRREQYAGVTPQAEMQAQVESFAYTLYTYAPIATSMKLEKVKSFSKDAIAALNSYITSLDSTSCSTTITSGSNSTSVTAEVDLYVVIDSSWQFTDIQRILVSIAEKIDLNSIRGSRLSVFTGNSFMPLVNGSMSYIEFYQYFNQSSYMRVGDAGFQLRPLLATHIKSFFQNMYDEWIQTTSAGGPAPVVLFVPNGAISISDADLSAAQQEVNNYWNTMPDIKFLYMVTSGAERVQSLVVSQEDVITYMMPTTRTDRLDLSNLDKSLKKVHKRITNSICSYNRKTQSYSSAEFMDYVQLGYINYYKVDSKYLFGAGSISIKVQNVQYGTVQVCYSRRVEYPMNNTQTNGNDITCITGHGGDKEISLSSPCGGYEKIQYCPSLYIAVLGQQSIGSECTVKGCKDVTDIQMKISHQGLTCGVSQILGNKMLITTVFLALLRSIFSS